MSRRDQDFLRFVREQMQKEAQELDTARVTLRIEAGALIVSEHRTIDGRLRFREGAHPIGIDGTRLDKGIR